MMYYYISNHGRYKRYRLSDGKDFSSLFFPEKDALLRVLEHFEDKSGEFSHPPTHPHTHTRIHLGQWPPTPEQLKVKKEKTHYYCQTTRNSARMYTAL